ncbi:MAG: molecular chaperone TorD family protein [Dehalococcoidia bacterium]|nr:molecular chaperone TorD family protein [Dehalococcoidia bacterium]
MRAQALKEKGARRIEEALARAAVYRLLSRGLAPDPPQADGPADADHAAALDGALARLAWAGLSLKTPRRPSRTAPAPGPAAAAACPPYETEYTGAHVFMSVQQLADVAGFYRAFGVRLANGFRERPDHVAAELEFMYLLTFKEARALSRGEEENAGICRRAQARFLEEHLGRWLAPFAGRVRKMGQGAGRSRLARLARDFVAEDARRLGVHPQAARTRARPEPAPELQCPAGGEGSAGR